MPKTISVVTWSYENKDWEKKNNYQRIWVLIEKDNWEMSIKFDDMVTNYFKLLFWAGYTWRANIYDNQKKDQTKGTKHDTDNVWEDLPF